MRVYYDFIGMIIIQARCYSKCTLLIYFAPQASARSKLTFKLPRWNPLYFYCHSRIQSRRSKLKLYDELACWPDSVLSPTQCNSFWFDLFVGCLILYMAQSRHNWCFSILDICSELYIANKVPRVITPVKWIIDYTI